MPRLRTLWTAALSMAAAAAAIYLAIAPFHDPN